MKAVTGLRWAHLALSFGAMLGVLLTAAPSEGAPPGGKERAAPTISTDAATEEDNPTASPDSDSPAAAPKEADQESGDKGGTAAAAAKPASAGKPRLPPLVALDPASAEAQYMAALDKLIAPLREITVTPDEAKQLKDAIRQASTEPAAARAARAQIQDPAARKLADWLALKGGVGEPHEFSAFIAANPAWPDQALLRRRAEEQLLAAGGSAQRIKDFFKGQEPQTGAGLAALASAHMVEGNEAKAKEYAAKAWRDHALAATFETGFLERFGSLLSEADHKRRLDRALITEGGGERSSRAALARRLVPLLSESEQKKAEARIAVLTRSKSAGQLLAKLSAEPEGQVDWGLAFSRAQHLRRSGENEAAWKILKATPTDAELLISPDQWWLERRAAAYAAIRAGNHEAAYDLVRNGGPLSVNPLKEQTHLAGWIALRLLGKPELALPHLQAARDAADGPLSKSRGNYWMGRALEALGRQAEARKHYETAALVADTFHGQLARHKLGPEGPLAFPVGLPAMPSDDEARRFVELDAVRAAVIATKAGLERSIRQNLFGHLRNYLEREGDVAMLAHLAASLGDIQTSLRVGKAGIGRSMNLAIYAYPVQAFPDYKPLREPPETAILLGIARQETEFNSSIVSSAGARGLLQVMPITARHVCKDHKVQCDIPRLLSDDAYNASISSAYIGDRMAEFRGSYVLTLAGYNAGPGRARQWVRELGDPRDPAVDVIDWIERIPIEETREYVKKVLSNIQVYRARLSLPKPLRLAEDLSRRTEGRRQAARNEGDATVKND